MERNKNHSFHGNHDRISKDFQHHILIVEDDSHVRSLIFRLLEQQKYRCAKAHSAEQAFQNKKEDTLIRTFVMHFASSSKRSNIFVLNITTIRCRCYFRMMRAGMPALRPTGSAAILGRSFHSLSYFISLPLRAGMPALRPTGSAAILGRSFHSLSYFISLPLRAGMPALPVSTIAGRGACR